MSKIIITINRSNNVQIEPTTASIDFVDIAEPEKETVKLAIKTLLEEL